MKEERNVFLFMQAFSFLKIMKGYVNIEFLNVLKSTLVGF